MKDQDATHGVVHLLMATIRLMVRSTRESRQIVTSGTWGNQYVYFLNWAGGLFRENLPQAKWHPMNWIATRNESRFPIVTRVVARK